MQAAMAVNEPSNGGGIGDIVPTAASAAAPATASSGPKPKRPLSAFNLFYRFKRQKVLDAIAVGKVDKDDICKLIETAPGMERHAKSPADDADPDTNPHPHGEDVDDMRRAIIRKELENNLLPRDTRDRQHRTNSAAMNGTMSFLELGKLMNTSWKDCDDFAKGVFNELAEEGRQQYRRRLRDFKSKNTSRGTSGDDVKTQPSSPSKNQDKITKKRSAGSEPPELIFKSENDGSGSTNNASSYRESRQDVAAPAAGGDDRDRPIRATASHAPTLRSVSNDYGTSHSPSPLPSRNEANLGGANDEASLRARVKELEGQLAAERLRARVRELESVLVRQRSVEEGLRAQLEVLTRNHAAHLGGGGSVLAAPALRHHPSNHHPRYPPAGDEEQLRAHLEAVRRSQHTTSVAAAAAGADVRRLHYHNQHHMPASIHQDGQHHPPSAGGIHQDGLWSLVSASMIHPSVQANERAAMLSVHRHHSSHLTSSVPEAPAPECDVRGSLPSYNEPGGNVDSIGIDGSASPSIKKQRRC